jgi:hypothetical protein
MLHHHLADGLGGNFGLAEALQFAHDLRDQLLDLLQLDRPLAQRNLDRAR